MTGAQVLVLDHNDSFVFILVDQLAAMGAEVRTLRTHISLASLQQQLQLFQPQLVLLSPGPGSPEDAGVMLPWLQTNPALPVLGVCLGHQVMGLAAGGKVTQAREPVHGRASRLQVESQDPLFQDLPSNLAVARYHSLLVTEVPPALQVIARTDDQNRHVMAMRHRTLPQIGLQFHPESVLTPLGGVLLQRILNGACSYHRGDRSFFTPCAERS